MAKLPPEKHPDLADGVVVPAVAATDAAPSIFLDGPLAGLTAIPDAAVLLPNGTELHATTADVVAIYGRTHTHADDGTWRWIRSERR